MIIDNSFQSLTTVIIYIHTQRDRDIITNWFSTKTHTHTHKKTSQQASNMMIYHANKQLYSR